MASFSNTSGFPMQTAYQKSVINCRRLLEAGEYDRGIALLLEVNKQNPRDIAVLRMLGNAMMMIDQRREAIRRLSFAARLEPGNADIQCELASALRRADEMRKAHQAADAALRLAPGYPRAVMVKARLLQSHAGAPEAYELVRKALEGDENPALLSIFGQLCRELKRQGEAIDRIRRALDSPGLDRAVRQDLLFVQGHLLDSIGEYDEAFECFHKGNAMSPEGATVDLDKSLARWAPEKFAAIPRSDVDGSRAVFIVGMPRSGTTLTEQILASHPNAGGVGESDMIDSLARNRELESFDQAYVNASGSKYTEMMSRAYPDPAIKRVCDKMPENYYFLGFIERILPGSHVIHCRRNPIDTCLSIYFQRFGPRISYASDLRRCGRQFIIYTRIMEHLRENLGLKMHEAVYERTTADPEPSIQEMLDSIGLAFDPACLEFHKSKKSVHTASVAQIRQPLYTSSTQRWRHYEKHIGPLLEELEPLQGARGA